MNQYEAAAMLREIAALIELSDPLPQKSIAYRKAANALEAIQDINDYLQKEKLQSLPGIGPKIAEMILSLLQKEKLPYYEELKKKVPQTLLELTYIPGLTLKKIRQLYEGMGIRNLDDLKKHIKGEPIKKWLTSYFIKNLKTRIASFDEEGPTLLLPMALEISNSLIAFLQTKKLVKTIAMTGALRRKLEVIGELSFVAVSENSQACFKAFGAFPLVKEIKIFSADQSQVILQNGIAATVSIVPDRDFAIALLKETGSPKHLSALVQEAKKHKLTWPPSAPLENEKAYYSYLGLDYIPPELRENFGEIKAAKYKKLPQLIQEGDLRGAFHCHTTCSDGLNSLEEMAEAARKMGWEYIGISDHSKSSHQAHGMKEEALFDQIEAINKFNKNYSDFQIFTGIECDILKDGLLDFSNDTLASLDFVIVSVHRRFNLNKKEMTKRLLKAIENPYTTIIGHLTGRQLRTREPYELDVKKIIDACIANHKIIELNATPNRLDMDWRYWIKAKEKGLLCSINPDAHSLKDLLNCQYGMHMARKGWLEKKDVINTKNLIEMRAFLRTCSKEH
ncbi:MAG: PHP domain-containing protein [Candidatus Protochlamydia sp.]|nr:PHP domain-containing protein [Candidatus Protochlamydia sp.]